jgi:hypothetical protein
MTLSSRGILAGTPTNGGTYTLSIRGWQNSNFSGDSATKSVTVTVVNTRPPVITTPPADVSVSPGQSATFSVAFTGDQPLTIRWLKEDVEVPNATNATLVLRNVQATNSGRYRVRLANSLATVFSDFVTLTVAVPEPPPGITVQPASRTVHTGEAIQFGVQATGNGLAYEWTRNGQPFAGTTPVLSLTNVTTADAGSYAVRISNVTGATNSIPASLTVIPALHFNPPVRLGDNFQLVFPGVDGRRYLIESAADLNSAYLPLTEMVGKTNGAVLTVIPTNATRVYRIKTVN